MYTLEQYENAKDVLKSVQAASDNYDGNNPDKFRTNVSQARIALKIIQDGLKAEDLLPSTEQEKLSARISRQFPKARSKDEVEFEGKRYKPRSIDSLRPFLVAVETFILNKAGIKYP
jgi:hypothetical protein